MKCFICHEGILLQGSDDEPKRIEGNPVCRDCYYEELGKIVEEHPIGFHKIDRIEKFKELQSFMWGKFTLGSGSGLPNEIYLHMEGKDGQFKITLKVCDYLIEKTS
jgi:hypothetical protein